MSAYLDQKPRTEAEVELLRALKDVVRVFPNLGPDIYADEERALNYARELIKKYDR